MKKSTRKVAISQDSLITSFLADKKNNEVIDYAKTRGIELRINNIGMLVVKAPKNVSERIYKGLSLLANSVSISKEDIKSVIDGKDIVVEERETKERWDAMEFRHKNGKTIYIKPKNQHQQDAINQIVEKQVIYLLGSAGTGKTMLAIAVALKYLEWKKISKIIITRPAIEAGQSIGFLPGSAQDKLGPFLYPIMSLLAELIGKDRRDKYVEDGTIEILPIGYSRGTTVGSRDGVFFLIDEAQNLDFSQHKLLLTRLGWNPNSKIIMCGDQRQSDLKSGKDTLSKVAKIISPSKHYGQTIFTNEDVVRSDSVKEILGLIEGYEDSL